MISDYRKWEKYDVEGELDRVDKGTLRMNSLSFYDLLISIPLTLSKQLKEIV